MLYSIWNFGTRKYDYYQSTGDFPGTHVTQATNHVLQGSQIGLTPEQFAARLPAGATRVGVGDVAKGQIASMGGNGYLPSWVLYGAIVYLAWRMFR